MMRLAPLTCVGAALVTVTAARAATITNSAAAWPTAPNVQTVDANTIHPSPTTNNRGISAARVERQSFRVPEGSSLTIGTIFLSAYNYNNAPFLIRFFESTDTNSTAGGLTGTVQVGSDILVSPFGATAALGSNLEIQLAEAERITLGAAVSPAGYVMAILLPDPAVTSNAFQWVHSNTGVNLYLDGRYRRDDGNTDANRDFGLALLAATTTPTLPGDYNGDGAVNAADYTVWADSFGQAGPSLPADGNRDGRVDAADYTVWADNFGQGTPPGGAIPEPTYLTFACPTLALLRRRR